MNNLRPTGKVIRQRKGHTSLCCLFSACSRKFEANFGNVGLSGRVWGIGDGGGVGWLSGMLQRCNVVRLRILYPLDECTVYDLFAIKSRHIMLQQQSQPLSMVNNIVYSYRFKHASKSQLLLDQHFINPTPSSWNNLPNVILLPFTLMFETSVKLKRSQSSFQSPEGFW